MSLLNWVLTTVPVAVIAVLLHVALHILPRKEYPVHSTGAIVITGVSSGIGRDAAIHLAQLGYTVYGTVRKEADAAELNSLKIANLEPIIMDVTDTAQIEAAVKLVASAGQPIVALVNNAGIMNMGPLEVLKLDTVRKLYEVNVFGLTQTTRAFLPLIRAAKGRIINLSSISGLVSFPGNSAYSGSKHAVEAISDALRREVNALGVSVSIIEPGSIESKVASKLDGENRGAQDPLVPTSAEMKQIYGHYYQMISNLLEEARKRAKPPSVTTDVIVHAITSPYPQTRYIVGPAGPLPAKVLAYLFWLLPDRVQDLIIAANSGAPTKK